MLTTSCCKENVCTSCICTANKKEQHKVRKSHHPVKKIYCECSKIMYQYAWILMFCLVHIVVYVNVYVQRVYESPMCDLWTMGKRLTKIQSADEKCYNNQLIINSITIVGTMSRVGRNSTFRSIHRVYVAKIHNSWRTMMALASSQ